jgi:hypothetical protein
MSIYTPDDTNSYSELRLGVSAGAYGRIIAFPASTSTANIQASMAFYGPAASPGSGGIFAGYIKGGRWVLSTTTSNADDGSNLLQVYGSAKINSALTVNGDIALGDATADTLTVTARVASNIDPSTTNARSLGQDSLRWAGVYSTIFYEAGTALSSKYLAITGGSISGSLSVAGALAVSGAFETSDSVILGSNSADLITVNGVTSGTIDSTKVLYLGSGNQLKYGTVTSGSATVSDWASSIAYSQYQPVKFNNSIFRANTAHTSSGSFYTDLDKWDSIDANVIVVNKNAHGYSALAPVYNNGTAWVTASASSENDCATHVIIGTTTNYFLVAESGIFTVTSHGKTTSAIYYANGGSDSTTPTSYQNPIYQVLDANTVEVISHQPVVYYSATNLPSYYEVTGSVVGTGSIQDMVTGLDGNTYPWLELSIHLDSTDQSTNHYIYANADNGAAAYNSQEASASVSTLSTANANTTYWMVSSNGAIANYPLSFKASAYVKTGARRHIEYAAVSHAATGTTIRRFNACSWTDTSTNLTKLSCLIPSGKTLYYFLKMRR